MDEHICEVCPCSTPGSTHCPCLHRTESADTPRLTGGERQALRDWWEVGPGWDDQDDVLTRLQRVVGHIVAGRLALIEAVCAQWDAEPSLPPAAYNLVDDVRAAMSLPPGQGSER